MELHNEIIGVNTDSTINEFDKINEKFMMTNRELKQASQELKELSHEQESFISMASHELNTSITNIQGFAQLLQDEKLLHDVEQSMHYADLITNNTERLYNSIVNMIDTFKINTNSLVLNTSQINLYELCDKIHNYTKKNIKNKDINVDVYIQENLPIIKADYEKIVHVLKNLISNSVKFTENGVIILKICRENNNIKFEVVDTGQGIAKENQKFIFSKFYPINNNVSKKSSGVGLGLFICKKLVDNMNGTIGFSSQINNGSTFYFTIPIEQIEHSKQ
jgi:signal transduction histidine kinase